MINRTRPAPAPLHPRRQAVLSRAFAPMEFLENRQLLCALGHSELTLPQDYEPSASLVPVEWKLAATDTQTASLDNVQTRPDGMPILNSRPNAPTAIYLDFDGHAEFAPYDEDGNSSTFNQTERDHIIEAWRHISVYFAMFDANVTTILPSVPMSYSLISNSITGVGYSYLQFNTTVPRAFNPSGDARGRQSGMAHEIGHNYGLAHQSDYDLFGNKTREYSSGFDVLHGPIMGVDFSQQVHKWFLGHPSGSPSNLQDDISVIAGKIRPFQPTGGDGMRVDDVANTMAAARALTSTNSVYSAVGIIERLADVDAYSFTTAGGIVNLSANPDVPSAVDLKMELYDASGRLLAAGDDEYNHQQLTVALEPGTYYVFLSSHGDYGDVGQYNLFVGELPQNWDARDIGKVGDLQTGGSTGYDAATSTFHVRGSGDNISGSDDSFRFVYQTLSGDGEITARVSSQVSVDDGAYAGVMIRESLSDEARSAGIFLTERGGLRFVTRSSTGGSARETSSDSAVAAPYWIRLRRTGNTFTAFRSADGASWTQVNASTISMNQQVYVGLAVTSNDNDEFNDAAFDSVTLTGNTDPTPPILNILPAPTEFAAALGTGTEITLSWAIVEGATGYRIERSADNINWTLLANKAPDATSHIDASPGGGRRWFYRIFTLEGASRSESAALATIVNRPDKPFNVTITSWQPTRLILNWRDVSGDNGYRIERSTDGVNFSQIATVGRNVPSYTDQNLITGQIYHYRVTALTNGQGNAPPSDVVSARTRLAAVTGLSFTFKGPERMSIRWNLLSNITRYRVERSSDGETFTTIGTVENANTFDDNSVTPLNKYYYRVVGVNDQAESVFPAPIFAGSPAATPATPWSNVDIGAVDGSGAAGFTGNNQITVIGAGADIDDRADEFHFVYHRISGDATITARLVSMDDTHDSAKAGVMFRESTAANSKHVLISITPKNVTRFRRRSTTGGDSSDADPVVPPDRTGWLRLERRGNVFNAYVSANGVTWPSTPNATATVSMNETILVGLALSSHEDDELNKAVFSNVTVTAPAQSLTRNGSLSNDNFHVQRRGHLLEVWHNSSTSGTPILAKPVSAITSLNLNGLDGNDSFVLDLATGNNLAGLNLRGGTGDDLIRVIGEESSSPLVIGDASVGLGSTTVAHADVELSSIEMPGASSLQLTGAAKARLKAAGSVFRTSTLSLDPAAQLDINDNGLILTAASLSDVRAALVAGRNAEPGGVSRGRWDGATGITSSAAAAAFAANNNESLSIAYGRNRDLIVPLQMFMGRAVSADDILVRMTRSGDATMDGVVNNNDITVLAGFYRPDYDPLTSPDGPRHVVQADFNYDGIVDNNDITILAGFYNPGLPPVGFEAPAPSAPAERDPLPIEQPTAPSLSKPPFFDEDAAVWD